MKEYSLKEVSEHKVAKGDKKDIWIVLHDKVYDVTKFLDEVSKGNKGEKMSNLWLHNG